MFERLFLKLAGFELRRCPMRLGVKLLGLFNKLFFFNLIRGPSKKQLPAVRSLSPSLALTVANDATKATHPAAGRCHPTRGGFNQLDGLENPEGRTRERLLSVWTSHFFRAVPPYFESDSPGRTNGTGIWAEGRGPWEVQHVDSIAEA